MSGLAGSKLGLKLTAILASALEWKGNLVVRVLHVGMCDDLMRELTQMECTIGVGIII